jgi:hypothetical protein
MDREPKMNFSVFLSASIPLPPPYRHERYFQTCDIVAIRESIRALVSVLVPKGKLVFGGHPAITPLIRLLILDRGARVASHIALFQSRYFEKQFRPEVRDFENLIVVDAVDHDLDASLQKMREEMIRSEDFAAGVFIGGMEGVEEEFRMFRDIHPEKPVFPIASTGAAAKLLFDRHEFRNTELLQNLKYVSLFRSLLRLPR